MVGFYLQTKSEFIASGLKLVKSIQEEERIREKSIEILDSLNLGREATLEARRLPFAQMRLVEVGRALATNPKILLLDEPSAGLNPYETEQMGDVLKKYRDLGITILFIEHDIDLVMRISDEIVVLNHGQKIAEGTPSKIRTDAKVISSYLGEGSYA
jgi:ABC-type branched-subunit amino acid transport system ATPase component